MYLTNRRLGAVNGPVRRVPRGRWPRPVPNPAPRTIYRDRTVYRDRWRNLQPQNDWQQRQWMNMSQQRQNQAYALERQQMQNDYNLQMQQMKLIGQNPQLLQAQGMPGASYGPGGGPGGAPGGMPGGFPGGGGGGGGYDGPPDGGQMQPPPSGFSFSDVPIWAWAAGGLGLVLLVARR